MKIKVKEVYYCEHCSKHGLSKHKMAYHEKICSKNPENSRPCLNGCTHLVQRNTAIYGIESERYANLFYCEKKQCFLYTPQNEIKGNQFDLGHDLNEPMPKNCDDFYCIPL